MLNSRIMTSRFSTRPLYLQVRDALGERIAGGEWKPSTAIPNEGDLARQFGVSPGTMRKALDLLEAERLLTRRQGRGTFVNDQSSEELAVRYSNIRGKDGAHVAGEVELLDIAEAAVSEAECMRLRCAHARAGLPHPPRASQRRQAVHARGGGHASRVVPRLVGEDRCRTASSCWRSSSASCWGGARSGLRSAALRLKSQRPCGSSRRRRC